MIRLSAGTAAALGLKKIRMDADPTTAYLFYGEECAGKCAFCPQAHGGRGDKKQLGRIIWPAFAWQETEAGIRRAAENGLKRVCIQSVRQGKERKAFLKALHKIKDVSSLPLSVSTWVNSKEEVAEIFAAGADRLSIALDVANPGIYACLKGGDLAKRRELLSECARRWPGGMSTHLICGLGEKEEEIVTLTAELLEEGITVGLFAFTPLPATPLVNRRPPALDVYRRIQAASFLLRKKLVPFSSFVFAAGRLVSFGLSASRLQKYLQGGEAFQTSGCPDCNRPYYNERPGGVIYNYPRPLTVKEQKMALLNLLKGLEEGGKAYCGEMASDQ